MGIQAKENKSVTSLRVFAGVLICFLSIHNSHADSNCSKIVDRLVRERQHGDVDDIVLVPNSSRILLVARTDNGRVAELYDLKETPDKISSFSTLSNQPGWLMLSNNNKYMLEINYSSGLHWNEFKPDVENPNFKRDPARSFDFLWGESPSEYRVAYDPARNLIAIIDIFGQFKIVSWDRFNAFVENRKFLNAASDRFKKFLAVPILARELLFPLSKPAPFLVMAFGEHGFKLLPPQDLTFSIDGKKLFLNSNGWIYSSPSKSRGWKKWKSILHSSLAGEMGSNTTLELSPTAELIAMKHRPGIPLIDVKTGLIDRELISPNVRPEVVNMIVWSADGQKLAAYHISREQVDTSILRVWDVKTGKILYSRGMSDRPTALRFSADGNKLFIAEKSQVIEASFSTPKDIK
ncbi:MAG: hypothetical protein J0L93_06475 [Deltaproteobacteria bacterium]|nr:hypothetical protein [Deltaproteobacteria bacterium]